MTKAELIEKINAYERLMRLDKPVGILLLLWPTMWALFIAANGYPRWSVLLIFVTGTVLMRSAGCVLNDIADRDFDGYVERTRQRPLATGEVCVKEAYVLAAVLILLAFVLVCFTNKLTVALSIPAVGLAASYPYMKRWMVMPQAYLGIAFGFGIPMAFAAIHEQVPSTAWILLMANVFWAIAYDTAYAMVDREDDLKIGIKSSAIFLGRWDVIAIMLCFGAMLVLIAYVGYQLRYGMAFYLGLLATLPFVIWQYQLIKHRNRERCFRAFKQNSWIGAVIWLAIFVEVLTV